MLAGALVIYMTFAGHLELQLRGVYLVLFISAADWELLRKFLLKKALGLQ